MKKTERTATGADALEREARKLRNYEKIGSPWQSICSADDNAALTCRENGIRVNSEDYYSKWNEFFWSMLESITTYPETPKTTRAWFERRGIIG